MSILSFLTGDPSEAYDKYAQQLQQLMAQYGPYRSAGLKSLRDLMGRYSEGLNNPAFLENELAGSYRESPYAKAQSQYLTNLMNQNAAATGTLGSSYAASNLSDQLQRLLSRDEQNYIDRGIGTYNRALGGEEGINTMGYNALGQQTALGQQAALGQLKGQLQKQSGLGSLLGGGLGLLGDFLLGPEGSLSDLLGNLGSELGNALF